MIVTTCVCGLWLCVVVCLSLFFSADNKLKRLGSCHIITFKVRGTSSFSAAAGALCCINHYQSLKFILMVLLTRKCLIDMYYHYVNDDINFFYAV